MSVAAILFLVFIVLLLINVPIAISLGAASLVCMIISGLPLDLLAMQVYSNLSKFMLLAIPFFVLAGNIMEKAGISEKLVNLCDKCVGHKKGGLAIVVVITSCFFAAISGSGPASVASLGVILIPAMIKAGYGKGMPSALMSSSGSIGIIIPPKYSVCTLRCNFGNIYFKDVYCRCNSGFVNGCVPYSGSTYSIKQNEC